MPQESYIIMSVFKYFNISMTNSHFHNYFKPFLVKKCFFYAKAPKFRIFISYLFIRVSIVISYRIISYEYNFQKYLHQFKRLRGYIHLCSRKKADFYDFFFLEKQHIFFKLNAYLFIQVEKSFTNFFKKKNSQLESILPLC